MDELEHASAFEESLRERAADRVVPFPFGTAVVTESLARVWDLNLLRVDRPGATAAELAAEAERIQGAAKLRHRRVVMLDDGQTAAFAELGWEAGRFLFMRYRGGGRAAPVELVTEVDRERVRPIREPMVREAPWADDEDTIREVLDAQARVARAARARHFAVVADGRVVSAAELFVEGTTAQVEDVVTEPDYRGRGYASAVVLAAVEQAHAAACDFVFLVADDEDWPKELYVRLGFEPIGRKWTFLRKLD